MDFQFPFTKAEISKSKVLLGWWKLVTIPFTILNS